MGAPSGAASHDAVSGERIAVARCARGRTRNAFARATVDLFGEGALASLLASLSEADRAHVDDTAWIPVEQVVRFCEAAWKGPLAQDPLKLRAWTDRKMDHGFAAMRRLLLDITTPAGLLRRGGELWRDEFSDGRLVAYSTSPTSGVATLHDHVFIDTEVMRFMIAESFRYALHLSGATDAREHHTIHGTGALLVQINW